jgi:RNA polymerase sigma factor (sigma-70 family)
MNKYTQAIIESIRNGRNDEALNYLYKDPLRKVRKYILSNSGTLDDANDVFQDAVVALFHYIKTNKYNEEYEVDAFLFRVAKNSWIDNMRKNKKVLKEEFVGFDIGDDSNYLTETIAQEKLNTFHHMFNKLEENCKKILSYVIFDKKNMKEIAILMGLKNDNIAKNQHYRCKKYFSQILSENKEALNILKN